MGAARFLVRGPADGLEAVQKRLPQATVTTEQGLSGRLAGMEREAEARAREKKEAAAAAKKAARAASAAAKAAAAGKPLKPAAAPAIMRASKNRDLRRRGRPAGMAPPPLALAVSLSRDVDFSKPSAIRSLRDFLSRR